MWKQFFDREHTSQDTANIVQEVQQGRDTGYLYHWLLVFLFFCYEIVDRLGRCG